MPTLPFPFHLANHNKDAAINILIIFISIGLIIFNVNYFHTTIVKNEQIINQPTNAFQSEFSLAALWRNENHAGVKDANPVAVNQETPKLSIVLNGIVLTSNDETSFVLINEGNEQKRYSLNEALESAPGTFIRKINKTSVVFETHGHYEKVTLHPGLPLLFIVRAVIPIKFIDMVVVVPSMSVSVVVHVNVFSSSLTLMKPENPALRS